MNTCIICKKEFKYNYLLIRHTNSKRKCKKLEISQEINNDIINDDNNDTNSNLSKDNFLPEKKDNTNCYKNDDDDNSLNINKNIQNKLIIIDKKINRIKNKIIKDTNISIKKNKCIFCDKEYKRKYILLRHINNSCENITFLNIQQNKLLEEKKI
jgi:hypothetical protein